MQSPPNAKQVVAYKSLAYNCAGKARLSSRRFYEVSEVWAVYRGLEYNQILVPYSSFNICMYIDCTMPKTPTVIFEALSACCAPKLQKSQLRLGPGLRLLVRMCAVQSSDNQKIRFP